MKTYVEEFTYLGLVERTFRKIKVDGMLRITFQWFCMRTSHRIFLVMKTFGLSNASE